MLPSDSEGRPVLHRRRPRGRGRMARGGGARRPRGRRADGDRKIIKYLLAVRYPWAPNIAVAPTANGVPQHMDYVAIQPRNNNSARSAGTRSCLMRHSLSGNLRDSLRLDIRGDVQLEGRLRSSARRGPALLPTASPVPLRGCPVARGSLRHCLCVLPARHNRRGRALSIRRSRLPTRPPQDAATGVLSLQDARLGFKCASKPEQRLAHSSATPAKATWTLSPGATSTNPKG